MIDRPILRTDVASNLHGNTSAQVEQFKVRMTSHIAAAGRLTLSQEHVQSRSMQHVRAGAASLMPAQDMLRSSYAVSPAQWCRRQRQQRQCRGSVLQLRASGACTITHYIRALFLEFVCMRIDLDHRNPPG